MVSFENLVYTVAGMASLGVLGLCGWGLRTLLATVRTLDKIEERVTAHTGRLDAHGAKHDEHEEAHAALDRRITFVEARGCSVRGDCAPRGAG